MQEKNTAGGRAKGGGEGEGEEEEEVNIFNNNIIKSIDFHLQSVVLVSAKGNINIPSCIIRIREYKP